MDCPRCGGKTEVISSNRSKNLGRYRIRYCLKCEENFKTTEIYISALEDYHEAKDKLEDAKEVLTELREELYDVLGG